MIPVQLNEIRQIEVVKGPSSALFGFNAASGVINIVTLDPLLEKSDAVSLRGGTQDLREGSGVVHFNITDNAALRASIGGSEAQEFKRLGLPRINLDGLLRPYSEQANLDFRWQVAPKVQIGLQASASAMARNFPADQTPENDRNNSLRASIIAATPLGDVQWDNYRTAWNINYQGGQAQEARNAVLDSRLSDLFLIGTKHTFRVSAEFKDNRADGQFFNDATIKQQIFAVGGMWDWQALSDLSFTNSIRFDHMQLGVNGEILPGTGLTAIDYNQRSLAVESFNSGIVWAVDSDDTARLTLSRGYQLPSLNDLAQQIFVQPLTGPAYYLYGQPALRPTGVTNLEADFDHKSREFGVTLRATLFAQRNSNLFGYDAASANFGSQSANTGRSNEWGGELSLKGGKDAGLRWNIGYSYALIIDHHYNDTVIPRGVYTSFNGGTPKHSINFGIGDNFGKWEFDLAGRVQSSFQDWRFPNDAGLYYPVTVPAYVTGNGRLGYKLDDERTTLSLVGTGLNQARLYERASIPVERRLILGIDYRL
jgi:iron complex outermembrane receptor protein